MARLSNAGIRKMTLDETDAYVNLHPAEDWRFAKAHGNSSATYSKTAEEYSYKAGILFAAPDTTDRTR